MAFEFIRRQASSLAALALLGGCSTFAHALTLQVAEGGAGSSDPCAEPRDAQQYPNIRSAIACAQDGDIVLIGFNSGAWQGPDNRDLLIDKSITLRGLNHPQTTTLDAQHLGRHILVTAPDIRVTLENIVFRNGLIETTDANEPALGGSIFFQGEALDVSHSSFHDNAVVHSDDGEPGHDLTGAFGGAISAIWEVPMEGRGRKISISDSQFIGNSAANAVGRRGGAAIAVENYVGTPEDHDIGIEITRSSFFSNTLEGDAFGSSGAVIAAYDFDESGKLVVSSSFISSHGNGTTPLAAPDVHVSYSSLAMFDASAQAIGFVHGVGVTSIGTLFLNFGTFRACHALSGFPVSLGFNLDNDGTCPLDAATDLSNITSPHAVLSTAANGMAYIDLETDSPAIDAGTVGCIDTLGRPVARDQFGNPRPNDGACDIGAFESNSVAEQNADPVFEADQYASVVHSGAEIGTLVDTVAATDADTDDVLQYAVVAGNTGGTFAIGASGDVTVASPQLLVDGNQFSLTIDVSDGHGGHDSAAMQITVEPANLPPSFDQTSYAFEITRQSTIGAVIGVVSGSDPEGGKLSYAIVDANEANLFAIDAQTGEITVAASLVMADEIQTLQIEVRDEQGLTGSAAATVTVVDQQLLIFAHGFEP